MITLKANGKKKKIKDEFIDVTLNELATSYKYVYALDAETKRYLLEEGENVDESKLFEFKLKWVSMFSNFTVDELRLVPLEGDDDSSLSVEWLYNHCKQFLKQPESYLQLKEFDHKGKTYNLIEPIKTISGAEMLFGNANYRQFMLGSQLASMIEKKKGDSSINSLTQLFALLYSDGNDSSEDIVARSKVFGNVNALYGWSAYFFFVELVERYKDYFRLSTTKNPPAAIQRVSAIQQLKVSLSKTIFGKLLLSKWLKQEYLILKI
jgi:hypothetical protein